jgi:hypothetical protein
MKMEQTECSKILAFKLQMLWITQKKAYDVFFVYRAGLGQQYGHNPELRVGPIPQRDN